MGTEPLTTEKLADDMFASYRKTLNTHGYGFQYAVLKKVDDSRRRRNHASPWDFKVSEFPVMVRGNDTRIDFVLRHTKNNMYLLAECKRANPAVSNWCFAKAPYVRRGDSPQVILQKLTGSGSGDFQAGTIREYPVSPQKIYHIGTEVRTGQKGDSCGKGRGAIEQACTQICRGLNGMMGFFVEKRILGDSIFLPVIFTTAHLYTSDINLANADLNTGRIGVSSPGMKKVSWLLFQYHQSLGIRHSIQYPPLADCDDIYRLGSYLWRESARTIAIVNPSGIENFLEVDWAYVLS